ncbi:hypothetical protein IGI04_027023 [Brassica rapa subsp. trilocularis]|uniref:Polycomb protein VEFS-Box domain-containing protein n=1 Tax=Brassica rapa subsp. trilocularis TaxID=1813537 RepID=A0ABQ7L096_BRACM|nr:hypothetical protein IGI04_027023 [Brassica rapa subsp. trilocularis]
MLEEHATGWGMKRDVDDSDDVERFVLTWKGHSVVEKFEGPKMPMGQRRHVVRTYTLELNKSYFDKLIVATVKKENISLHNTLLRGLIKNVCVSNTPPLIKNGLEETSLGFNSLCNDLPKSSPRKGRTQQRFSKDCNGKSQITEVVSSSFKQQWSMEDGEEVDQLIRCWRSQPIEALFGVNLKDVIKRRRHKKLEEEMEEEGVEVSVGFANSLNAELSVFLQKLIKPCLEIAVSKSSRRGEVCSSSVYIVDFK